MYDKHADLKGRTFETWQELWAAMSEQDFETVYTLHKKSEALRSLGMYRNRQLKDARNLIGRFLYRQKLLGIKKPLKLTNKVYADPLPSPKNIQEIWENLTDEKYSEMYLLSLEYCKQKHNPKTRRAYGLICRFRKHCRLAGLDYPKGKFFSRKQPKDHPWRLLETQRIERIRQNRERASQSQR
ncbi:hypothetical protein B0181_11470 [Moraxella caviae]|uniref:Uncharacterized protein n=1 Tax=Moraxella caviae TaxID=34060 RepID=A0A1S9ZTP7_9GAMM|nr:hypothetical protein [Moraxella caviae]OOR86783.1 hypothetical protein B0181_11470 [Moraxella caviae]STZ14031.1 Uncharacterised protein [Moraxella caviae]STZ14502.1 Uncharacterised protein [Moraxella caviae]VEW11318.1 Uncharacterised protein [Moraxella caviae]VEW12833.1 Uncharacterised protein [Moraxella caviae]